MLDRKITLDYARFFAISLVVIGHLIQYNDINFDENYLFKMIYSFHMPLFIFISGYVSFNSLFEKALGKDINQKSFHLLLPFFIWGIVMYTIQKKYDYINLVIHPDSAYWFLWVLFWIYSLLKITILLYNYKKLYAFILVPVLYMLPSVYLGYGLIKYLSIYFILGLLTFNYQHNIYKIFRYFDKTYYFFILVTVFLLLAYYYERANDSYYNFFNSHAIYVKILIYGYKIVLAMIGIILVLKLSRKMANILDSNNFLLKIGQQYTLAIYVTHYYFLYIYMSESFYISIAINTIIMFLFLIGLYFLLQSKYNYMNHILFGIKKGKVK